MRKYSCFCLIALLLTACGDSDNFQKLDFPGQATPKAPTSPVMKPASPAIPQQSPPVAADTIAPSREETARQRTLEATADKILAWNNRVQQIMARGTLADKVAACVDLYKETWRLPHRPKGFWVRDFAPIPGLVKGGTARMIDELLANMDKASDNMLTLYGKLEKYMRDSEIQDDGNFGLQVADQVLATYGQYLASRKDFLAIVKQKAQEAEDILLKDHPLKRQIRLAQDIFTQLGTIGEMLLNGEPQLELVTASEATLQRLITEAGKPPFQASPAYERLYRQFLKAARNYVDVLQRGLNEGFHSVQKRELLKAMETCRQNYNQFAAAINGNP